MGKYDLITAEFLKTILDYNPETGLLVWKWRPQHMFATQKAFKIWNKRFAGKPANSKSSHGYYQVRLFNKQYLSHILVWVLSYGCKPPYSLDHINGIRSDNRLCNLRIADNCQNSRNRKIRLDSCTRVKGVSKRGNAWCARLDDGVTRHFLGYFKCPAAASLAYQVAADRIFGEFARW